MFLLTVLAAQFLKYGWRDWGFARPNLKQALIFAVLFGGATTIPSFIETAYRHETIPFNLEYFLFELTMPGLHEEPLYRGLLLYLWDRAVGTPFKLFGINVGFGALISSLFFVLGHTFSFDHAFHPVVAPCWIWLDMGLFAASMVWLRYKFDNFWIPVFAHNLGNAVANLAQTL
ncbi:MAG: CPBP family intramembrane metalloprotease [Candidatus Obscuribacterales bacterium]|nr:CPBP family intramembrane metalloprotease [Candidatus Obscuribacterales bacterium]